MTVTSHNYIHKELKSIFKSVNVSCRQFGNFLSRRFLSKNVNTKIQKKNNVVWCL